MTSDLSCFALCAGDNPSCDISKETRVFGTPVKISGLCPHTVNRATDEFDLAALLAKTPADVLETARTLRQTLNVDILFQ